MRSVNLTAVNVQVNDRRDRTNVVVTLRELPPPFAPLSAPSL